MTSREPVILGIDPGHKKCGLACVTAEGEVLHRAVVPSERLGEVLVEVTANHLVSGIVVGDGTCSRDVVEVVAAAGERVDVRDETGTTLLARRRYWQTHPPRGLWRLVPTSLRLPPEPFDDLVAVILAERLWLERETEGAES